MAKLCNQKYHCDFSTHGPFREQVQTSTSSPLATLDWVDRIDKVACVKNWYNKKCHCEGKSNLPCGDTAGALVYNIPNRFSEGSLPLGQNPYPTKPGERIFSEIKWQTQVPKSEAQQYLSNEVGSSNKYLGRHGGVKSQRTTPEQSKRNKKIGIAAGIGAAIAGLFAWGIASRNKKKKNRENETLLSGLGQSRRPNEEIMIVDENTGQLININQYKRPTPTYFSNDEKIGLYVLGGIGLLALTIIIVKK